MHVLCDVAIYISQRQICNIYTYELARQCARASNHTMSVNVTPIAAAFCIVAGGALHLHTIVWGRNCYVILMAVPPLAAAAPSIGLRSNSLSEVGKAWMTFALASIVPCTIGMPLTLMRVHLVTPWECVLSFCGVVLWSLGVAALAVASDSSGYITLGLREASE